MNLLDLRNDLNEAHRRFTEIILPFRTPLWNYCRYLTGSPWDGEDLYQETLLKVFAMSANLAQPVVTKSFLYRIATNKWIDELRRNNRITTTEWIEDVEQSSCQFDRVQINEMIETFIYVLPPRQVIIYLLIDVYEFTAGEVAEMVSTSQGAVYACLRRARENVRRIIDQADTLQPKNVEKTKMDPNFVNSFVEAFNRWDFVALSNMLADHATFNFVVNQTAEYGKETITKYSLATWEKENVQLQIEICELWGKQAVVFLSQTQSGLALWDVNYLETLEGKIIKWDSYYFCKEFLSAAAKQLGMRLDQTKKMYEYVW